MITDPTIRTQEEEVSRHCQMSGFLQMYGFGENPATTGSQFANTYHHQHPRTQLHHRGHNHHLDNFDGPSLYDPPTPATPTYTSSYGRDSVGTLASSSSSIADKVIETSSGHPEEHLDMMKTYFHADFGDTVLFRTWVLRSSWDTFLTCVAFLLLAILYEGIKCYREHLYKRLSFAVKKEVPVLNGNNSNITSRSGHPLSSVGLTNGGTSKVTLGAPVPSENTINPRIFSIPHLIQSGLHVTQVVLSYSLMLAFMTFNVWICFSILLGAGLGYFMFYWRKITIVHVTDCH